MSIPSITPGNTAPEVDAGPDQSVTLPDVATLQGIITDDGIPGSTSVLWSQASGPGDVSFSNATQLQTDATFPAAGGYTFRLTGSDGELLSIDDIDVAVALPDGSRVIDLRIQDAFDDAEEKGDGSGSISRTSKDLEIVDTDEGSQTVGIRIPGVGIQPDAAILDAWLQFQTDEVSTDPGAVLTIEGDAAVSASPFLDTNFDISSRSRTNAAVTWEPPPWPDEHEEGPRPAHPGHHLDRPGARRPARLGERQRDGVHRPPVPVSAPPSRRTAARTAPRSSISSTRTTIRRRTS